MLHYHTIVSLQILNQIFQNSILSWIFVLVFQGWMIHIDNHQSNLIIYFLISFIRLNSIHLKKYKCLIHGLRPFKNNNMCKLCDNILDKDNKGRLMVKKCSLWGSYRCISWKYFISAIEKLSFHIAHVRIIDSMNVGRLENIVSPVIHQIFI